MILVNIESLSISELRSIAEQEGIADSGTLSREELISLLEEIYEEEDEGDGESDPNMRYMSGLTDYRGVSIGEIPDSSYKEKLIVDVCFLVNIPDG